MKKILVSTLIAIMVGATLTGCGNSGNGNNSIQQGQQTSLSAKEIVEKLGEEELFMMPMMVEDEMAQEVYNLHLDDVVDYGILVPGITAQQDEIIVVKAKEGKVDAVKASLEEHLKDLLSQRLYPTYMEAAEEAKVEVNGDLVSLFILDSEIKESVEEQYYKLLQDYGKEQLNEVSDTESFEGNVVSDGNYKLNQDYFLGDLVQVKNEFGIEATPRIIEIIESEDEKGTAIVPKFSTWEV